MLFSNIVKCFTAQCEYLHLIIAKTPDSSKILSLLWFQSQFIGDLETMMQLAAFSLCVFSVCSVCMIWKMSRLWCLSSHWSSWEHGMCLLCGFCQCSCPANHHDKVAHMVFMVTERTVEKE